MTDDLSDVTVASRRDLLLGGGAAAFVLAFSLPGRAASATSHALSSPAAAPINGEAAQRLNAFLAIDTNNIVTAIIAQTEGGQGNSTGMPQVLASELGADWGRMRVQFTTERRPEFINPSLYEGLVLTAGSTSISSFYDAMRTAAAATREMFVAAAARRWQVPPSSCSVANSFVMHDGSTRKLSFGELAEAASKEAVPAQPRLRSLSEMKLIGQRLDRLDGPAKIDGSARYGLDADVPGMLYAAVRHGPVRETSVASLDDSAAKAMPGVHLVMAIPQGVAVVADQYWQAAMALAEVHETYTENANNQVSSEDLSEALRRGLDAPGAAVPGVHGDVVSGMAKATTLIEAEFSFPLLSHACIEPVSCTASVQGDHCEIWLSTKSPTLDSRFAAAALGIDPLSVVVHNEYQGGDFGRRSGPDHTTEAVLLAKAAGRPVKVIWTRQEDLRVDQHRTAILTRARLGLGADGRPLAFEAKVAGDGVWRSLFPWWYAKMKPVDLPMFNLVGGAYAIPNETASYTVVPQAVRIGAFRGNGESHNGYVMEALIDEAAHVAKQDPLGYRRALLANDSRSVAVIDRVGVLARWGHAAAGRYQGVAFYQSAFYGCRLAAIVEVSNGKDGIKVEHVTAVCDSGLVINPMLAERCLEGGLVFGLSNALFEEITLAGGAPEQHNFDEYRVMRMNETPDITVEVISVGEKPGSFGEIGVVPVGAALANAIFQATGERLRSQPFSKSNVKFAL
jgi:isoquinoline 1-oxidoreductase beta subunit